MCVVLLRQDGGEWWVLALHHRRGRRPTPARTRRASRSAGTRWRRASARRRPGRASPAPSLAALVAGVLLALFMLGPRLVDGHRVRPRDPRHGDRRRPGRIDDQARSRHQGHELLASRPRRRPRPPRLDPPLGRRPRWPSTTSSPPWWHPMTTTEATPSAAFPEARGREKGYEKRAVDAFLARARDAFEDGGEPLTAAEVRQVSFPLVRHGYAIASVDAALGRIEDAFAARERAEVLATRRRPRVGRADARDRADRPRSAGPAQARAVRPRRASCATATASTRSISSPTRSPATSRPATRSPSSRCARSRSGCSAADTARRRWMRSSTPSWR